MQYRLQKERGFTLIEICISLIIIGLMLALFIAGYNQYFARQKLDQTQDAIGLAVRSLNDFAEQYGVYPCPADKTLGINDPNYARSNPANCVGPGVYSGMMPAYITNPRNAAETLSLMPLDGLTDSWRNRLNYAVSKNMAQPANCPASGNCVNQIEAGTKNVNVTIDGTTTQEPFVVFSSGPGGQGAYNYAGALVEPCAGGDTNCVSSTTNNFTFTEEFRTGSLLGGTPSAVGYSDDFYGMQRQFSTSNCDPNEIATGIDADGDPICSPFPSQSCGPGQTVTSVTGNAVTCSPLPGGTCPANQIMVGLNAATGQPICQTISCDVFVPRMTPLITHSAGPINNPADSPSAFGGGNLNLVAAGVPATAKAAFIQYYLDANVSYDNTSNGAIELYMEGGSGRVRISRLDVGSDRNTVISGDYNDNNEEVSDSSMYVANIAVTGRAVSYTVGFGSKVNNRMRVSAVRFSAKLMGYIDSRPCRP